MTDERVIELNEELKHAVAWMDEHGSDEARRIEIVCNSLQMSVVAAELQKQVGTKKTYSFQSALYLREEIQNNLLAAFKAIFINFKSKPLVVYDAKVNGQVPGVSLGEEWVIVACQRYGLAIRRHSNARAVKDIRELAVIRAVRQTVVDNLKVAGFVHQAQDLLDFFQIVPDPELVGRGVSFEVPLRRRVELPLVEDGRGVLSAEAFVFSRGTWPLHIRLENGGLVQTNPKSLQGSLVWRQVRDQFDDAVKEARELSTTTLQQIREYKDGLQSRFGNYLLAVKL